MQVSEGFSCVFTPTPREAGTGWREALGSWPMSAATTVLMKNTNETSRGERQNQRYPAGEQRGLGLCKPAPALAPPGAEPGLVQGSEQGDRCLA